MTLDISMCSFLSPKILSLMFLQRRKFVIETRGSKKKYTFITERSKIAKYLCNFCSSQHKFNNEMSSRQLSHSLVSGQLLHHYHYKKLSFYRKLQLSAAFLSLHAFEKKQQNRNVLFYIWVASQFPFTDETFLLLPEENIVQYAAVCRAQRSRLKSVSCSETPQDDSGLTTPQDEPLNKLCDDVTARIEGRIKQQRQSLNEQRCISPQFSYSHKICFSAQLKYSKGEGASSLILLHCMW